MELPLDGKWIGRFWKYVIKSDEGCWEWTGANRGNGYGVLKINGKLFATHRLAWYLEHQTLDRSLLICHKCDNRQCVRPDHLFLGTYVDNAVDMVSKGRATRRRGEAAYNAVLTDEAVPCYK